MTTPSKKSQAKGRTLDEFGELTPAEQKLLAACRAGEPAIISDDRPEKATDENTVRAEFVRFLALGGDDDAPVHEYGVHVQGAWIEGELQMRSAVVPSDLYLGACHFGFPPMFSNARIGGILGLSRSWVPGIKGDGLRCEGSFLLRDKFISTGDVLLMDAQIGGTLDCGNATFIGNVLQENGRAKYGHALSSDRIVVKGSIFLNRGFNATGAVRLMGAQIGGNLDCMNATFDGKAFQENEGNIEYHAALFADRTAVKGGVFLSEGFNATGMVRFLGAQIGGNLECANATFDGKLRQEREGNIEYSAALAADSIVVKGNVFLRDRFSATGAVRLPGARIEGDLDCGHATFDGKVWQEKEGKNEYGNALFADRIVVKGGVFLHNGFASIGETRLLGAQIGGGLECDRATFDGKFDDSKDGKTGKYALNAQGMKIDGVFIFKRLSGPIDGISLVACHARVLADDEGSWGNRMVLDGFIYGSIAKNSPTNAAARMEWLDKQSLEDAGLDDKGEAFKPQPWRQLIKALREMGHAEEARQVAIAFEDRLREAKLIGRTPPEWWGPWRSIYRTSSIAVHWALGKFTGYGHRPQFLFFWMLGVWLGCGLFYTYSAQNAAFAPSSPPVVQQTYGCKSSAPSLDVLPNTSAATRPNWYSCDSLPESYPRLNPLVYSLDVLLPPVNLQQSNNWGPVSSAPDSGWLDDPLRHLTRSVVWLEHLFGWLSTGLLLAMVSGVMKRRED